MSVNLSGYKITQWLPNDHVSDIEPTDRMQRDPIESSTILNLGDKEFQTAQVFLQVVTAVLIRRYGAMDQVRIGIDVNGEALKRFDFGDSDTAESLMAGCHVDHPAVDDEPHAVVTLAQHVGGDTGFKSSLHVRALAGENKQVEVAFHFAPDVCSQETANRLAGHFAVLAEEMQRQPAAPVARLNILTEAESDSVLNTLNATEQSVTHHENLYTAFEARASSNPDSVAVIAGDCSLSYRELSLRVRSLARYLVREGVGPNVRVGVCFRRSIDFLIAALGVLGAGGAYVPLDPTYPNDRLLKMIDGVQCKLTLTNGSTVGCNPALRDALQPVCLVDELHLPSEDTEETQGVPGAEILGDHLCYVMHTSGSTGAPKPIALCHSGVLNNLADLNLRFSIGECDALVALSSTSFDMSVYEFIGTVLAGGTVIVPDDTDEHRPAIWVDMLRKYRVTVWNSAPALVDLLLDHLETVGDTGKLPLRLCMTGGDWVPSDLPARLRRFAPNLRFIAVGGATEASVSSTFYEAGESAENEAGAYLPIGRPLANQRVYVLDDSMMPVPAGVPGELFLAGKGLARGYLDLPDATAERFVDWKLPNRGAERLYRTGDLARLTPDGVVHMLGRRDFQVQIGGRRVELGEIETVLTRHPDVKHGVVVDRRTPAGTIALGAYVVPTHDGADVAALFATLREALPSFMIPAVIELIPSFPLSANGKIDRYALKTDRRDVSIRDPQTGRYGWIDIILAAWEDVLDMELTPEDDFFDVGGDSIAAIKSFARIDRRLKLADIYTHPTAAELAYHLDSEFGQGRG